MKFESFRFTLCHRRAAFALTFRTLRKSLNATTDGLFRSLLLIFFNFHANGCEKCGLRRSRPGQSALAFFQVDDILPVSPEVFYVKYHVQVYVVVGVNAAWRPKASEKRSG